MKQKQFLKKLSLNKTTIASLNGKVMQDVKGGTIVTNTMEQDTCNNAGMCPDNSCISHCYSMCDTCQYYFSDCCPC